MVRAEVYDSVKNVRRLTTRLSNIFITIVRCPQFSKDIINNPMFFMRHSVNS